MKIWNILVTIIFLVYDTYWTNGVILTYNEKTTFTHYESVELQNSKVFWVKGLKDGILGLFETSDSPEPLYEFLIGGGNNKYTGIRNETKGHVRRLSRKEDILLDNTRFKPFWLSWDENFVQMGSGLTVGSGIKLSLPRQHTIPLNFLALRPDYGLPISFILELECSKIPITDLP
ncbi:hypothetical protein LOTGIDRAFT_172350 [Lottia gigantea]|uniref:Farnesoic acid O-methyl transferase domain-containing protein n=1 Tax=Lottia gigantea TaxID=225164 RepID=V4B293_LOTGI|nr:hypothetical protein LOTGIDRAFT_172350 [Lottia gigantea]ESP01796.1 hypothetical protein LOTGIDRAFT_172350 [Lottia gigantea]